MVVHHLAQHATVGQPGEARQVERRLGMTGPLEDATGAGSEGEDVPRPGEVGRRSRRVDQGPDGQGPIMSGDAGGGAVPVVDRHGERGPHGFGVVADHQGQIEVVGPPFR